MHMHMHITSGSGDQHAYAAASTVTASRETACMDWNQEGGGRGSSRSHAPSVHPAGWHLALSLGARPAARDPCACARVRRSAMRRRRAVHARRHRRFRVSRRVWSMWLVIARTRVYDRSKRTNALTPVMHAWPGRGGALQAADHEVSRTLPGPPVT